MATTQDFVEYVHEQSGLGKALTYKKMFGEYALYLDGKVVALACDNSLYIKPTNAVQHLTKPFTTQSPYPGAKPHLLADELLEDAESLRQILIATATALPAPKARKKKTRKK